MNELRTYHDTNRHAINAIQLPESTSSDNDTQTSYIIKFAAPLTVAELDVPINSGARFVRFTYMTGATVFVSANSNILTQYNDASSYTASPFEGEINPEVRLVDRNGNLISKLYLFTSTSIETGSILEVTAHFYSSTLTVQK